MGAKVVHVSPHDARKLLHAGWVDSMEPYQAFLDAFVVQSQVILKGNLVGIYLHGSAAMGCFHPQTSDIDLLIVVKAALADGVKRRYLDMVTEFEKQAPPRGIELSVVRESVCSPFIYPTPFELHYSIAHRAAYQADPAEYIRRMQGTDRDLAAHFMMVRHRGKALCGKEIPAVFAEVSPWAYLDSIWRDVAQAREGIAREPVYFTLNLCRVLAFQEERLLLSKQEGGAWGLKAIGDPMSQQLIASALQEYQGGPPMPRNSAAAAGFAQSMLERIQRP